MTTAVALFSDLLAFITLHIYVCYFLSRILYARLLRTGGKRFNVLRNRTDTWEYDTDQLLFGTILFTLLAFLFPTVLAYYALFAMLRLGVILVNAGLDTQLAFMNHFPLFSLMLRAKDPWRLPGGIYFGVEYAPGPVLVVKNQPVPFSTIFIQYIRLWNRLAAHYNPLRLLWYVLRGRASRSYSERGHAPFYLVAIDMMKLEEAKKLCPELVVVHVATYKEGEKEPGYWDNPDTQTHKVSLDLYRRESVKMIQMYKDGLPENAEIEKASIDEAFMDLTKPARQIILERFPWLAQVPDDAPLGLDTPLPPPPQVVWNGLVPSTWHDVALAIAAECMEKVRQQISSELGYTTSAGIARNKFLAKLCASYRKPMNQSILRNAAIPNYLKPLPFTKIRFLGGKLGKSLATEYDVSTVADLLGIDYTEVKEKSSVNKSMLASKNLPQPITKVSEGYHWIRVLAAELALRLNEARESNPEVVAENNCAQRAESQDNRRSKQAPWPFVKEVTVDVVAAAADKLWKEFADPHAPMKIIGIGLAFTGVEGGESGLKSIDSFFTSKPNSKRALEDAEDAERDTTNATGRTTKNISKDQTSFVCSRCGQRSALPRSATRTEADRQTALAQIQMEHEDFHLALDLSKVPDAPAAGRESMKMGTDSKPKKKRRKESPQGIAKFFNKS
ncbi:DNA polymerase eta [Mycena sanguinolenta]|uniref:DNA polymerase eta n=1 Tax=Mycena sanguinolenta TaxID=230812 RepID=A0A8H6ZE26_9AGAR|nr:DNA polymerase eta [Mycena sanguinolenta]